MNRFGCLAVAALLAGGSLAAGQNATWRYVPPIPGNGGSLALGLSANGQQVVGSIHVPGSGYQPFRWDVSQPDVQPLGASAGHILGDGVDISDDGQTVVGVWRFQNPGHLEDSRAFRWRAATGYQFMQPAAGQAYTYATAASANGTVLVGHSTSSDLTVSGGRWPSGTAFNATGTGTLFDVSASGTVAAGISGNFPALPRAVRWTSAGVLDLGVLPGHNRSVAYGITRDGTRIVGTSANGSIGGPDTGHAFMWTAAGMQDLGGLAGASRTALFRINDAATIGIGYSNFDLPNQSGPAIPVIWTAGGGFRTAASFFAGLGLDIGVGGFSMTELRAISGDGFTIVGYGNMPIPGGVRVDGFVVTIPGPGGALLLAVASLPSVRRRR